MQSASFIAPSASMKNTSSSAAPASSVASPPPVPLMKALSVAGEKIVIPAHPSLSRTTQDIVTTAM